jgi:DHA2 family multidrug resistance protein
MLQTVAPVAGPAALAYINAIINKQALFIAYLDDFKLMMIITFAVLPLLFFMKRGNKVGGGGPQPAAME